jgi:hypothetical protein
MHACPSHAVSSRSSSRCLVLTGAVKTSGAKNVVCSKTIIAQPDKRDKVAAVLAEIVNYSEERAKDKSSGVIQVQCVKDQWDDDTFHCYERCLISSSTQEEQQDGCAQTLSQKKLSPVHLLGT